MIFKGTCPKCGRIITREVEPPKITDDITHDETYVSAGKTAYGSAEISTQDTDLYCPTCKTTFRGTEIGD